MATYFFETITQAQAASYTVAADNLVFSQSGETAPGTTVSIDPGTGAVTLVSGLTGKSVQFPNLLGEAVLFANGGVLIISAAGANVAGDPGGNLIYGSAGADTIAGEGGSDTLHGGSGADVLSGGSGQDIFAFAAGQSGGAAATSDRITDWSVDDALVFPNNPASSSEYLELTASSFDAARSLATGLIGASGKVVSVQVGADVVVFADMGGGLEAVTLVGRALADISFSNFGGLPAPTPTGVTVTGGQGSDTLSGGVGHDLVTGDASTDRLAGLGGNDTLDGGSGSDTLTGDAGADRLTGGSEGDTFTFAPGDSGVVPGGLDIIMDWRTGDRLSFTGTSGTYLEGTATSYEAAFAHANERIGAGTANYVTVAIGSDLVVFVDSRNDNGTADDAVVLLGRSLADIDNTAVFGTIAVDTDAPQTLIGGTGDDSLLGGSGPDKISGNQGADTLAGAGGDDLIWGDLGVDSLSGGEGNDQVIGQGYLQGDGGDDNLQAGGGNDTLNGGAGDDGLHLDAGDGSLVGGDGDDSLEAQAAVGGGALMHVTMQGGDGDDGLSIRAGASGIHVAASGGAGADSVTAIGAATGQIDAGSGDDRLTLYGFRGQLSAQLGAGVDTLEFFLDSAAFSAGATPGLVTLQDFETTQDRVDGDLTNALAGWTGQNPFTTGHLALAASGSDTLLRFDRDGGANSYVDIVRFVGLSPAQLNGLTFFGFSPSGESPAGDTITGSASADGNLRGGIGADSISALGGGDHVYGEAGNDTIDAGAGDDIAGGGLGDDVVHGGDGNDILQGADSDHLFGEGGADTLVSPTYAGGAGVSTLDGGDGNDRLFIERDVGSGVLARGADGEDTFVVYGTGAYVLEGGAGDDRIQLNGATQVTATLGAGRDTVTFDPEETRHSRLILTDFQAGTGGDRLDLVDYLGATFPDWDGETNPFLLQLARLVTSGADTILQISEGGDYLDRVILQNVSLSTLTAENLGGFPADGSPAPGVVLAGTSAGDTLSGGVGADTLSGLNGADSLTGGRGGDSLAGGEGGDTMDGGIGWDVVGGGGGNDSLSGGLGQDTQQGESGDDTINGGDGEDSLSGGAGADGLSGMAGRDTLSGGAGADFLAGLTGSDVYEFAAGDSGNANGAFDTIIGWEIGDYLRFGAGPGTATNYLEAAPGTLEAAQALANAAIAGGVVDYVAVAIGQNVYLFADSAGDDGGADDMVILFERSLGDIDHANFLAPAAPAPPVPATGAQTLHGSSGPDVLAGGSGADSIGGGDGGDQVLGLGGNDTVAAGAGDDDVEGGVGDDQLDGGTGRDTLSYLNAQAGVTVSLEIATAQAVGGGAGTDSFSGFENLDGSLFGDRLTGDGAANLIRGWSGDDTLQGGAGDDTLDGRDGADSLVGGDGADQIRGGGGRDEVALGGGADTFWVGSGDSGYNVANIDLIVDWSSSDRLQFGYATGHYAETSAATFGQGFTAATQAIAAGARYVAVQIGADVVVFADTSANGGAPEDAVLLPNRTLADISVSNLGSLTAAATLPPAPAPQPAPEPAPAPPPAPSGGGGGGGGGDIFPTPQERGSAGDDVRNLPDTMFSYDGGAGNDWMTAGAADNLLFGGDGDDTVTAGGGNDTVVGGAGRSYLRGDEGDDRMIGGADFDDINGNMGRDTINGGVGDDWVVGGKDGDIIFGEQGRDLVYGNIGEDVLGGGIGDDVVRGGQGNDICRGDDGDDYVSGDRGSDTMDGGLGADILHTFSEAGLDYVVNFNAAEGDRVQVDPGTIYTIEQVGADVVIDMGGGNQMILANVQLTSLPDGWIFGA